MGIGVNRDNVYSRFNSAGILTTVDNSEVNIDGNVDFRIYGNGITANAAGSRVSIGGGRIEVPSGKKYGYYAIGAYQGTVNVNAGKMVMHREIIRYSWPVIYLHFLPVRLI